MDDDISTGRQLLTVSGRLRHSREADLLDLVGRSLTLSELF